jgi:hypothetical protein
MYPELDVHTILAHTYDEFMTSSITNNLENDRIVSVSHAKFLEFFGEVQKRLPQLSLSTVFNSKIENWYHCNVLTFFYTMVYCSEVYFQEKELNTPQVYDCLRICYDLVTIYDCSVKERDYYDETLEEFMYVFPKLPGKYYYKAFLMIAKHGKNIKTIQNDLLRIKAERLRKKKKSAIQKIEEWWFNIVNNPYHAVGKRMLETRATEFYKKYVTC